MHNPALLHVHLKTLLSSGVFLLARSCWMIAMFIHAVSAQQPLASHPVDGERLDFRVTYEWGPLYLEVGDATFTSKSSSYEDVALWSFDGWGTSRSHWNWFYPVNSVYSSVADAQLKPLNFQRKGTEGSHRYDRWYDLSDPSKITWSSNDPELKSNALERASGAEVIRDVMTAVHWCRHLPWDTIHPGTVIPMNLVLDGAIHHTTLLFQGTEMWMQPEISAPLRCWVFEPVLIEGTVFKAGDHMRVYVTADSLRIPVFIETELIVGAARIYLKSRAVLEPDSMNTLREEMRMSRDAFLQR